jgi:hypothetical protein
MIAFGILVWFRDPKEEYAIVAQGAKWLARLCEGVVSGIV